MIKFLEFKVEAIKTLDYQKKWENVIELMPIPGDLDINNWGDILRRHHSLIGAGTGTYSLYGMESYIRLISDEDEKELNSAILHYFPNTFGENNILSIKSTKKEEEYVYGILIYPQVVRALCPDKWFDVIKDGESFCYSNDMLLQIKEFFEELSNSEVTFDKAIKIQQGQSDSIAKVDLIKDMSFAEPGEYDYKERIYDAYGTTAQKNRDMPFQTYRQLLQHAITYFTVGVEKALYIQVQNNAITIQQFIDEVSKFLVRTKPDITENDKQNILKEIYDAVFGNYILEPLLNDLNVSDIKVLSPQKIRVKCNGKRMTSNITFIDDNDYFRFFQSLAIRYGLNYNEKAIHVRTDQKSNDKFIMRINITTPEINSGGYPYLHIRKIRKKKMTPEELIRCNCMPRHVYNYLRYKINTSSIIFCGKGGSGKTTMMNTMIEDIAWDKSGLVIQESEELFSEHHPDFMFQHIVAPEGGWPGYSLQDEAKNGLLTDLDYFIIGEIKGGEALYFLNAAMTGHKCICSVHAPDTESAIDKLADYVMYESPYNKEQAVYMLKEMKCIVYMENFKVKEISEIVGYDNEKKQLIYKKVYQL